jgi:hypothetical protein
MASGSATKLLLLILILMFTVFPNPPGPVDALASRVGAVSALSLPLPVHQGAAEITPHFKGGLKTNGTRYHQKLFISQM